MQNTLIGLDVGTSGVKCTVFDTEGRVITSAYCEYSGFSPENGLYELDSMQVFYAVIKVIRDTVKKAGPWGPSHLAVTSFGEAATAVDRQGNVLRRAIMFNDERGAEQAEYIAKKLGRDRIVSIAGVSAHPTYTVCKAAWIKDNEPGIYEKTWKFLLFEDFINFMLTGRPVIDYSLASRTMAFDVRKKEWCAEILDAAGLRKDIFSDAVPAGAVVGQVKKEICDQTGLHYESVVVAGGHDQAGVALGSGVVKNGMAVLGIGSTECFTFASDGQVSPEKLEEYNFNFSPHLVKGMYYSIAYNFTGGSLLRWYKNDFAEIQETEAVAEGMSVYQYLDRRIPKKPTDIFVLPHFSGAGTPTFDVNARGAMIGLNFGTGIYDIYKALMEGSTYEMKLNLSCMEDVGIRCDEIVAVGGGAKSDAWLQIKANIFNKTVYTLAVDEAGTLAAAILGGKAAGVYATLEEGVGQLVKRSGRVFVPEPEQAEQYAQKYEKYIKIYDAVKSIYA